MTILVPSWYGGGPPQGASPIWSQACDFWRSGGVCPGNFIVGKWQNTDKAAVYVPWDGGVWTSLNNSSVGTGCAVQANPCGGSTPSYCQVARSGGHEFALNIDVWKAFADGVWSSSVVFLVRIASSGNKANAWAATSCFTPLANPGVVISDWLPAYSTANICTDATTPTATVTLYDDGHYTVV